MDIMALKNNREKSWGRNTESLGQLYRVVAKKTTLENCGKKRLGGERAFTHTQSS